MLKALGMEIGLDDVLVVESVPISVVGSNVLENASVSVAHRGSSHAEDVVLSVFESRFVDAGIDDASHERFFFEDATERKRDGVSFATVFAFR